MGEETYRIEIPINVEDRTNPGVSSATQKVNAFDKANQKMQARLNQINKTKYQVVLSAIDKASNIIGTVGSKVKSIAGKTFHFTMKVLDVATAPLRGIFRMATSVEGAILGATGAWALFYKPMEQAGNFEQTQIAFTTMLKSAKEATKFLKQARSFANKTPFEMSDVTSASKLLLAFGFKEKDVLKMLTTIGDTASGLGAGSDGIDRIVRALGRMQAKGHVTSRELMELQSLGIPVTKILEQELGLTAKQIGSIGKEGVSANAAINAILTGMKKRYGGMMTDQSKTALGMISTIKDTLTNNFIRPWGQGLWKGFEPGLAKLTNWLDKNQSTVDKWSDMLERAGGEISTFVMNKINALKSTISSMVNSKEWKETKSPLGKLKIAWDTIIAEPFNKWWNSKGKAWLADKASKIGEGIGTALKTGILGLLGIDAAGAVKEGTSIGAAFSTGFAKGFDANKVKAAIKKAVKGIFSDAATLLPGGKKASSTSGLSAALILYAAHKLGLFKLAGKGAKGLGGLVLKGMTKGTETGDYSAAMMTVNANVVYLNSSATIGGAGSTAAQGVGDIFSGSRAGGNLLTTTASSGNLLTGPTAAAGGKALNTVLLKNGTYAASGGTLTTALAHTGVSMGSGATTAGGAAAAGAAGIAGGILGAAGLVSSGVDLYKGIKASKAGDKAKAKEKYITSGTKAGMVATGAAIGAGIGTLIPLPGISTGIGALVGAGIGGVAALTTGSKAGKAINKSSESGWLNKAGKATGNFFTKTLPSAWDGFWGDIGNFFTKSIPKWWGGLTSKVGTFFKKTLPRGWDNFWKSIGKFFTKQLPFAVGYAAGKTKIFFSKSLPNFFTRIWNSISKFFTKTLPKWASGIWNGHIVPFFTETIPGFFSKTWKAIVKFSTKTIPKFAGGIWNGHIVPFFTETIPGFFKRTWKTIVKFSTKTIPKWAGGIWNDHIAPFFTQTIPNFFGSIWNAIIGFFTKALPNLASSIWGSISNFFTSTVPNFFKDIWGTITHAFNSGYTASGATKHAYGGIMTKAHMGIVAEAGPESIIPLSPSKRNRGYDIWKQTGHMLGVQAYGNGGIVGDNIAAIQVKTTGQKEKGSIHIDLTVQAQPKFTIAGAGANKADEKAVLAVIKANIKGMTDDIGNELAIRLEKIFSNMPTTEGA